MHQGLLSCSCSGYGPIHRGPGRLYLWTCPRVSSSCLGGCLEEGDRHDQETPPHHFRHGRTHSGGGAGTCRSQQVQGPDGKVVYQDMPCEAGAGQELNIRTTPSAQPGEASSKPAIQPAAQPSKASVLRAEQDERAAMLTELNAKGREFRYKDCVNRKELIKSRARACQLGACPNLAIAENEVRFLKMYGAGLPDDCETLNPNRGRGDEVVRQGLRISLEAPLRKGACRPGAYKELTQMTERKSQTMRVWLSA